MELDYLNKNKQNNEVAMETIRENKEVLVNGRVSYFTELVKVAVRLTNEIKNESSEQVKELKSMLVLETVTMLTSSWRNTLPFNLFVSKEADKLGKSLGIEDLRNHDYSLKFGMNEIIKKIEEPDFLSIAENLNDQDLAKLNKALKKEDKALNANVLLHWEHAYTGKMFNEDIMEMIETLSSSQVSDQEIFSKVEELVKKQAIVWLVKPENYVLADKGFKDIRTPNWETAYKTCGIELCEMSKVDYKNAFGIEY